MFFGKFFDPVDDAAFDLAILDEIEKDEKERQLEEMYGKGECKDGNESNVSRQVRYLSRS